MGEKTLMINLIVHHSAADVLNQTAKPIYIFGTIQELRRLGSLFQWDEVLENIIQFPYKSYTSDWPMVTESVRLPFEGLSPLFLLSLTLRNRRAQ